MQQNQAPRTAAVVALASGVSAVVTATIVSGGMFAAYMMRDDQPAQPTVFAIPTQAAAPTTGPSGAPPSSAARSTSAAPSSGATSTVPSSVPVPPTVPARASAPPTVPATIPPTVPATVPAVGAPAAARPPTATALPPTATALPPAATASVAPAFGPFGSAPAAVPPTVPAAPATALPMIPSVPAPAPAPNDVPPGGANPPGPTTVPDLAAIGSAPTTVPGAPMTVPGGPATVPGGPTTVPRSPDPASALPTPNAERGPLDADQLQAKLQIALGRNNTDELEGGPAAAGLLAALQVADQAAGPMLDWRVLGPVATPTPDTLTARLRILVPGLPPQVLPLTWKWLDGTWKLANSTVCDLGRLPIAQCPF